MICFRHDRREERGRYLSKNFSGIDMLGVGPGPGAAGQPAQGAGEPGS